MLLSCIINQELESSPTDISPWVHTLSKWIAGSSEVLPYHNKTVTSLFAANHNNDNQIHVHTMA